MVGVDRASAAPNPADQPAKGLLYKGLQGGDDMGPCKGRFQMRPVAARGGPARCTHGPDPAPDGIDARVARQPETPTETALRPEAVA